MLSGNVDEISRMVIAGWAADDAMPEQAVDVTIFVNGCRMAQTTCMRLREDLVQSNRYGSGRHGFRYEFSNPLRKDTEHRVLVVFSSTGEPVPRGNKVLSPLGGSPELAPLLVSGARPFRHDSTNEHLGDIA